MNIVKTKGLVLSYCFSRCNELALKAFGYKTFNDAFSETGKIIGENPNNIRNMRDEFDPFLIMVEKAGVVVKHRRPARL